jgi:hypothetical protein
MGDISAGGGKQNIHISDLDMQLGKGKYICTFRKDYCTPLFPVQYIVNKSTNRQIHGSATFFWPVELSHRLCN